MIVIRWIVGAIVALACVGAITLDFTMEHRPRGGWIYVCKVTQFVSNGTLRAQREVNDHGVGQDYPATITWKADDITDPDFSMRIDWQDGFPGRDPATMKAEIVLQLNRKQPTPEDWQFAIERVADKGGPKVISETYGATGYFDMAKAFTLSRIGEPLVWTFGKSPDDYEKLGSLPVFQLRKAAAAMPALKRRLDAVTPHYATKCPRAAEGMLL